jgi:hypothetical protein
MLSFPCGNAELGVKGWGHLVTTGGNDGNMITMMDTINEQLSEPRFWDYMWATINSVDDGDKALFALTFLLIRRAAKVDVISTVATVRAFYSGLSPPSTYVGVAHHILVTALKGSLQRR